MREMMDSGVEWIGEMPKGWETIQIKKLLAARDGGSWGEEPQNDQLDRICYRVADFDFSRLAIVNDAEFTIRNYTQPIIDKLSLEQGDILVEKSGGGDKTPVGRAVFFDKDEPALFANFIERLRVSSEVSPRYFFYVWIALYLTGFTNNYIKQTTGIQNLDIKSLVSSVFVPSFGYKLQHRIADYLDAKCAQIDRAIARQQEVIEKLKEYKLSVITEAVTKGLNPDVPMKDSGIEWIGEIPGHWEVKKMARLIDQTQNGLTRRDLSESTGQIVLKLKNITAEGQIDISDCNRIELTESEKAKYILEEGDFLFVRVNGSQSLVGKCAMFYGFSEACAYNDHIIRVQLGKDCHREYVHWFFQSESGKREVEIHINTAAGQYTISGIGLRNIKIIVPPIEEQNAIDSHLAKSCDKIESLIERKSGLIEKLTEYKKSLIYEVVTGKREV